MFIRDAIRCGNPHLDEVCVRINGKTHYLWRAGDHEGEVVEVFVTKRRERKAALQFLDACDEALWPTGFDRHGQATVISCGDEGDRQ